MTYAEKLKNPLWQKKRLEILSRDNFTCQHCFSTTKTLHVHHLDYISKKEPWDYPEDYLLTLCEDCHSETKDETKEHEDVITRNFRLKIKNSFNQKCVSSVFRGYKDLSGIFYLLWELMHDQEEVDRVLTELYNQNSIDRFLAKSVPYGEKCVACGEEKTYLYNNELICCAVCTWKSLLKKEELNGNF